jgi:hypothetical protein
MPPEAEKGVDDGGLVIVAHPRGTRMISYKYG